MTDAKTPIKLSIKVPKLFIFDLDETLTYEYPEGRTQLHQDIRLILSTIFSYQIPMIIVSHNLVADKILKKHQIDHYFHKIVTPLTILKRGDLITSSILRAKLDLLTKVIADYPNIAPKDMLFFDDQTENLCSANKLGISNYLIEPTTGLTYDEFHTITGLTPFITK